MFLNRDGIFYEPVAVSDSARVVKSWMIRLICNDGLYKKVLAEESFNNRPSEEQILYCLAKHRNASFAVIEEVYKLEDDGYQLPFN